MNEQIKKVVGIKYKHGDALPKLILKGCGSIAEDILKNRNSHYSQKVYQNKELVKTLYRLPIDAEITKDTYEIVAILLAHVFAVNQKLKETINDRYIFRHTSGDAERQ